MVGDYKLLKILDSLRTAVMDDGRVTLGETSVILRTIRPFVLKGEPGACELDALLQRVRSDGVITDEESNQIAQLMDNLLSGRPRLADFVREIRDFPKPGVLFRDVTGILESGEGFNLVFTRKDDIDLMTSGVRASTFHNGRHGEYISVEEGHFDAGGRFVPCRRRCGDESDFGIWTDWDVGVIRVVMDRSAAPQP